MIVWRAWSKKGNRLESSTQSAGERTFLCTPDHAEAGTGSWLESWACWVARLGKGEEVGDGMHDGVVVQMPKNVEKSTIDRATCLFSAHKSRLGGNTNQ